MSVNLFPNQGNSSASQAGVNIVDKETSHHSIQTQTDTIRTINDSSIDDSSLSDKRPAKQESGKFYLILTAIVAGILGALGFLFSFFRKTDDIPYQNAQLDAEKQRLDELVDGLK